MKLYPAIDLKDGQCVRLYQGRMDAATVYNDDPAAQAKAFETAGCHALHLVDLNGAFAGQPVNGAAVERVVATVGVPVQLGGGIRDLATIAQWLDRGVDRVILGTLAVRDPDTVIEACRRHPGRIAVGIDACGGRVAVEGWAETADDLPVAELARRFEQAGVAAIVFTDIDRDGTLSGVNVDAVADLAEAVSIPIIASGGVRGLGDLQALVERQKHCSGTIEGVIAGRALYDGTLDLGAALALLEAA
ncbi:1-(5-phosphoribosyl)-5-[(5-phosphoribosylamino)methylideneamino]imidazole-4-carboxamide isomerase [Rhodothalassium salexigens]|uniref:1-(5-phosphoribosyl)-5-[(5- phosphoribosylamino)methylideneamino]imidazole-4- carboxamide isomerase n=1 Tax=Rhodothalassium salexigens TaxID=1086 RepID=UPI001911ED77|nr:1-(5-phosphoribosyl)-5-[(5-phosphoribosylamino)methylideneamino]imidazole-4-carboxamide isomerase [Rhodothalassium salexigens]MBK5921364.1 1-(5-phosphoribosyl)-5-[(5-phosphoribosylamino)methylideneamino]imidazole-4-carboxamide isomerase [Rhodothalassium salexigens]